MTHERNRSLMTILANIVVGIFFFLFLFITELALTYWFGKKIHFTRLLYYVVSYAAIGVIFGLCVGLAHTILVKLPVWKRPTKSTSLLIAVNIAGLLYFLLFIALNAAFLPYSSVFSRNSLLSNLELLFWCAILFYYVYASIRVSGHMEAIYRATGAAASMVVVLVIFHANVMRKLGGEGLSESLTAWLVLSFAWIGGIVAVGDLKLMRRLRSNEEDSGQASHSRSILIGKALALFVAILLVLYFKGYRPLESGGQSAQASISATSKPNIILVVLDTVRQDRLSPYGSARDTSPKIAEFAQESLVFDAYSTAPWTFPSHASIFTGFYPTEAGAGLKTSYRFDERNETLAEILSEHGYSTGAVVSNHLILHDDSGFAQGFHYYSARPRDTEPAFPLFASYFYTKFCPDSLIFRIWPCRRAEPVREEAIDWIEKRSGRPLFLFLNFMDAHTPYAPVHPYDDLWPGEPSAEDQNIWLTYHVIPNETEKLKIINNRADALRRYDGEITYLDAQLGIFFDELKQLGIYDDSLIIITSDHGEFFYEHNQIEHTGLLYQEVIRVPLIVKLPLGMRENSARLQDSVSLADLFHSILKFVDVPHRAREGAVDLFAENSHGPFSEFHVGKRGTREFAAEFGINVYSLLRSNYKLIYFSKGVYELYDIAADPYETRDLMLEKFSDERYEIFQAMKSDMGSQIEQINAAKLVPAEPPEEMDQEIRARMKALGYIN